MFSSALLLALLLCPALVDTALTVGSHAHHHRLDGKHDLPQTAAKKTVGIWYETWYCVHGRYIIGEEIGVGAASSFLRDVSRDGLDDVLSWYPSRGGIWTVAVNLGQGQLGNETVVDSSGLCGPSALWAGVAHVTNSTSQQLLCVLANYQVWVKEISFADAPRAQEPQDLEQQQSHTATEIEKEAFDAPSSRAGNWTLWLDSLGMMPDVSLPLLALDVNGDGLQDLLLPRRDSMYVALSSSLSFAAPKQFLSTNLSPFTALSVGDVNGDGLHDVGLSAPIPSGHGACVFVALSASTSFLALKEWGCFPDFSPKSLFLVPLSSSSSPTSSVSSTFADAISYAGRGSWFLAPSNGASFVGPAQSWAVNHGVACDHGKCGQGQESLQQHVGSAFDHHAPVPVAQWADGRWAALPPEYHAPNLYNTWEGWFLGYVPLLGKYDSGDRPVIRAHLDALVAATVDFILFDFTNSIGTAFIRDRGWIVCQELAAYRRQHNSNITYAIAIGGVQYSGDPRTMETEAGIAWDSWVTNTTCGGPDSYYHINGKPLIVSYTSYAQRLAWEGLPDHTSTDRFSVRWAQGALPDQGSGCPAQSGGIDPHKPWVPPPLDYGLYMGWGIPNGSLPSTDTMVVMPGWNNSEGCVVARNTPSPLSFYRDACWQHVLATNPSTIILNSWNEFAEQTAMEPSDSRRPPPGCEMWLDETGKEDPHIYWNGTTVKYLEQWRRM